MFRLGFILLVLALTACGRPASPPQETETPPETIPVKYGVYPRAFIQTGSNPLWFELTGEGPFLVPSPEEAALNPFTPWPLTRHIQGILAWGERLVLAANLEGFLILEPVNSLEPVDSLEPVGSIAGIELYRIDLSPSWEHYSLGAFLFYNHNPAVLLYRDDYFAENSFPPPQNRFWSLTPEGAFSQDPKAFSALPASEGWDLEILRQGPDGFWYFRGLRKGASRQEGYYGRTSDLSLGGEASTPGALQNAALPRPFREAPELLSLALEASSLAGPGQRPIHVAVVTAPEFEGTRYFADQLSHGGDAEEVRELYGYYHAAEDGSPRVLVIAPDGKGYYGEYRDGHPRLDRIALPPLPENFVYTGAALIGQTVLGTWEEQDEWNVGAAGFVLLDLNT
jgi:hypothetical protein